MRLLPVLLLLLVLLAGRSPLLHAAGFKPEGFGASSKGGTGGQVLTVTRLDDNPKKPAAGSLRWALRQKGPRIVKFAVSGTITLRDRIEIKEPYLTIDGSDAPGAGVCIRGGSLEFKRTNDIIVRHVRIRLGDETTLRKVKASKRDRPVNSDGLDCIGLTDCRRVLFDHCSVSWSCDELFGITRCQDVTIQWCILGEPLANPMIHPYGDNHAFVLNCSASTLSLHHCLLARFVMRGPQFECNDMTPKSKYTVRMEAVNNIIFDYERSGSRYSTGVEEKNGASKGKTFRFQFLNNLYITSSSKAVDIEPIEKHGHGADVRTGVKGNKVIARPGARSTAPSKPKPLMLDHKGNPRPRPSRSDRHLDTTPDAGSGYWVAALMTARPVTWSGGRPPAEVVEDRLFEAPTPVRIESVETAAQRVLAEAGVRSPLDAVDARLITDVTMLRFAPPLTSQKDVGGWPDLDAKRAPRLGVILMPGN
ncbi:hypothetical protein DES53_109165 [Roseimicrobium gellanilyticum]|uniref:Pectate lyase n=1 Tax=Roseimicrobium gellanilyticum TaxID=748857 RepID=A0A366HEK0_9BACT|nr:hypothetical protein [Roseimicrobium gellanilyticum]RBP39738.1 hypothetical protein DES53_109165 [Roseimicrobium gellanilyticum]